MKQQKKKVSISYIIDDDQTKDPTQNKNSTISDKNELSNGDDSQI